MTARFVHEFLQGLDRQIERLVMGDLRPQSRILLGFGLAVLLLSAAALRWALLDTVPVNLFFLVIIGACFVFRMGGMWLLIPMLVLYHLSGAYPEASNASLALDDLVKLLEWIFLGLFTVVSLKKYAELRAYDSRIETDMKLAMTLQRSLMPKAFESRKVRIDSVIQQTMQIGGDFFFFRPFEKKYVIFCLGDIMGKGISASLVMAMVLGFFYEWGKQSHSPGFILKLLNERLISVWGEDAPSFATLFYSIYDEESRQLTFCCGGHHGALWVKAGGGIETLKSEGIPLGIFNGFEWEEKTVTLAPGDKVVVFTDGVNEARNAAGDIYTMDKVCEVLDRRRDLPADKVIHELLDRVREFARGAEVTDDIALLGMEVRG
ncbi:MAG: PP2C family protein-serine/threonine phosphatase [Candidatus Xenobia bacterium]